MDRQVGRLGREVESGMSRMAEAGRVPAILSGTYRPLT